MVIHGTSEVAVQSQPVPEAIVTTTVPPAELTDCEVGATV
jgi:hypothetical protein